jgi:hypothetical protein
VVLVRGQRNTTKTIRFLAYMLNLVRKWHRVSAKLQEDLGRPRTQDEVRLQSPHVRLVRDLNLDDVELEMV